MINAKNAGVNVRVVNDSQTWPGTAFSQALSDEIEKPAAMIFCLSLRPATRRRTMTQRRAIRARITGRE